jgi:hypothetical protein
VLFFSSLRAAFLRALLPGRTVLEGVGAFSERFYEEYQLTENASQAPQDRLNGEYHFNEHEVTHKVVVSYKLKH